MLAGRSCQESQNILPAISGPLRKPDLKTLELEEMSDELLEVLRVEAVKKLRLVGEARDESLPD